MFSNSNVGSRLRNSYLKELCSRPSVGLTEVRRDGKDDAAIAKVINDEFNRCNQIMSPSEFDRHMRTFTKGCWVSISSKVQKNMHQPDSKHNFIFIG